MRAGRDASLLRETSFTPNGAAYRGRPASILRDGQAHTRVDGRRPQRAQREEGRNVGLGLTTEPEGSSDGARGKSRERSHFPFPLPATPRPLR
jgi:hypothetical protein